MNTSSQATSADAGAAKLAVIIRPLLDEFSKTVTEKNVANTQEILLAIEDLKTRFDLFERLHADKRKTPAVRSEKKAADAPTAEVQVVPDAEAQKSFYTNKMIFFTARFKEDAQFRAKYATPEIQGMMDKEPIITEKKKEDQKIAAQARYCWNFIKANRPETMKNIEDDFTRAKKEYEAATKPPQQVAEAHTPNDGVSV